MIKNIDIKVIPITCEFTFKSKVYLVLNKTEKELLGLKEAFIDVINKGDCVFIQPFYTKDVDSIPDVVGLFKEDRILGNRVIKPFYVDIYEEDLCLNDFLAQTYKNFLGEGNYELKLWKE